MSDSIYDTVARNLGVAAACGRALTAPKLGALEESFLRAHWQRLDRDQLLEWLALPVPEGIEGDRSNGEIVERLIEQSGGPLAFVVHDELGSIADAAVRDDLIERLSQMDGRFTTRLFLQLSGGRVFRAVAVCEGAYLDRSRCHPFSGVASVSSQPLLAPLLREERRDDRACLVRLKRQLDGPGRLHALGVAVDAGLVDELGPLSELVGDIPLLGDIDEACVGEAASLLGFARAWSKPDERRGFFVERALRHSDRSESWPEAYWVTPADLRDDVGLATAATPHPAPWALAAVVRHMSGMEAWRLGFALCKREPDPDAPNKLMAAASLVDMSFGEGIVAANARSSAALETAMRDFGWQRHDRLALLAQLAVPSDADEDFDGELADALADQGDLLLDRLAELPRTRSRCSRILRLALRLGRLWSIERAEEIAETADPITDPVPLPPTADKVPLFRALVGDERADAALLSEVQRLVAAGDFLASLRAAGLDPAIAARAREDLRRLAFTAPVSLLALVQGAESWLLSEDDVKAEAIRRPTELGNIRLLPAYLAPIIEARAATTESVDEAFSLLTTLERQGRARDSVFRIVVERIVKHGPGGIDARWVGRRLCSKSAWDSTGAHVADALLSSPTHAGARCFAETCMSALLEADEAGGLGQAMHTVLAQVLVRVARAALERLDEDGARRALTALAHLSPRSGIRRSVLALRKLAAPDDCRELIELNVSLLRRSDDEPARFDAIREALEALIGTVAGDAIS